MKNEKENPPALSPSGADLAADCYQASRGQAYHEGKRALAPAALEWVFDLRASKFKPWVGPGDVVFEFGVGSGWNLARLACRRRLGCDAATFLADRLHPLGIEFHARSQDVQDSVADVVICHHVLEHVADPGATLEELRRILRPEGRLILHVPWETERRHGHYDPNEPNHHLYNWTAQSLGNLVTLLHWRLQSVRIRRYGYDRFAANLAARFHLGGGGFRALRALLLAFRPLREVELVARRGPAAPAPVSDSPRPA